jgi:hypothetical protein
VLRTDAARLTVLRSPEAAAAPPLATSSRTGAHSLQLVHSCQSRAASGGLPRVPASGHQFNAEYKGQVRCEAPSGLRIVPGVGSSYASLRLITYECWSLLTLQRLKLTGRKPPFLKVTAGSILLVRSNVALSMRCPCPRPQSDAQTREVTARAVRQIVVGYSTADVENSKMAFPMEEPRPQKTHVFKGGA